MSELIRWEYAGHEFKVSPALSPDQRDGVCSVLLSEYDSRAERMSDNHRSLSKDSDMLDKVIDRLDTQSALEGVREGAGSMLVDSIGHTLHDVASPESWEAQNYAAGYYRVECRECGKGIIRSGVRGRPPNKHEVRRLRMVEELLENQC